MKKVLFGFFGFLYVMPLLAVDLSGTILDNSDEPLPGASIVAVEANIGTVADENGVFNESLDVSDDAEVEISYVGCVAQKFRASALKNKTIKLDCSQQLSTATKSDKFKERDCNKTELAELRNAKAGRLTLPKNGEKAYCKITECECGYKLNTYNPDKPICVRWSSDVCSSISDPKLPKNAKSGKLVCENGVAICKITACDGAEFRLEDNKCVSTKGDDCTADAKKKDNNVKAAKIKIDKSGSPVCTITSCVSGYMLDDSGKKCIRSEGDCTADAKTKDPNATKGELKKGECIITECADGYEAQKTKCVSLAEECGLEKTLKKLHAKTATWSSEKKACIPTECDGDAYKLEGDKCVSTKGDDCTADAKEKDSNATKGELKNGVCIITECADGYEADRTICAKVTGNCKKLPENATSGRMRVDGEQYCMVTGCKSGFKVSDDKKSCVEDKEGQAKKEELQKKYEEAKAKEQSTANKMLGGATMAATGIGGMMIASNLAEQNANKDAEMDMTAYLETFRCDYGAGKSFKGGQTNIELPGTAELIPLYAEYVQLANDLKFRKEQLGLKPGIEAEKILDSATTGLYDDSSEGIDKGAFASLARALQDPEGEDAKKWQGDKDEIAKKLKTGAIVAGAGAVVGVAGNAIINGDKKSDKTGKTGILDKIKGAIGTDGVTDLDGLKGVITKSGVDTSKLNLNDLRGLVKDNKINASDDDIKQLLNSFNGNKS